MRAVVTGITGQDGAYLAQLLLNKGYVVYGTFRSTSSVNFWRIQELDIHNHPNLHLVEHDLTDLASSIRLIEKSQADEIYNFAAQSYVGVSFQQPILTSKISGLGVLNLLEAIRIVNPKIRYFQASTADMFGKAQSIPQTESTPFHPSSPFAVAKLFAHWMTINYRESYDIFAVSGILFKHESPLRGLDFVTRKITDSMAKIKLGRLESFELDNLDAEHDWGYAKEYVEAMWMMLQNKTATDYVLATNKTETVRNFVCLAAKAAGYDVVMEGKGENEVVRDVNSGNILVKINPTFYRPAEANFLSGNPAKAKAELDWVPKTSIEDLCKIMVEADIRRNKSTVSRVSKVICERRLNR